MKKIETKQSSNLNDKTSKILLNIKKFLEKFAIKLPKRDGKQKSSTLAESSETTKATQAKKDMKTSKPPKVSAESSNSISDKQKNQQTSHLDDSKSKEKKQNTTKTNKALTIIRQVLRPFLALLLLILISLGALGGYFFHEFGKPLLEIKESAKNIKYNLSTLKDEFYNVNLENYDQRINTVEKDLKTINKNLEKFTFLEDYEQTESYYNDLKVTQELVDESVVLLDKSSPHLKTMMEILLENADEYLAEKELEREQALKEAEERAKKIESGEITEDLSLDDKLDETEDICRTEGDEDDPIYQILKDTELEKNADPTEEDTGVTRPFSLQEVVRTLPELAVLYNEIEPNLLKLTEIIQKYDLSYIPDQEFGEYGNPHKLLSETQELATDFKELNPLLKSTLKEMPELLGSEEPVTFLVVPQNDKELRASGGLLTAYGTMTINKGKVEDDINTYDMWILENYTLITLGVTPPYYNEYGQLDLMLNGCGAYHLRAQDSGIYPDNYVSMDMFKDYYDIAREYKPEEYPAYDHVVTFNTHFIADLIKTVEPLELSDGEIMCANNAAKTIFSHTSVYFDDYKTRKSYIGEVGDALQDKLFDLSAKDFLKVAQVGIKAIEAKHISLYSEDKEMQEYFDELGLTNRTVHNFDGDYFHFNEAQNCGLKANFYIYNNVDMDINIADNGRISKDIKVKWTNEKVYEHAERHILTDRLNWRYRAWLRLYGPKGTTYTNAKKKGMVSVIGKYYQSYRYYDDEIMKKQVYDDVMWFDHRRSTTKDPIKTASVELKMTSPKTIKYTEDEGYKLLIQKHPGKKAELYNISITYQGKQYNIQLILDRDKIIKFKDEKLTVEDYPEELDAFYKMINKVRGVNPEEPIKIN